MFQQTTYIIIKLFLLFIIKNCWIKQIEYEQGWASFLLFYIIEETIN